MFVCSMDRVCKGASLLSVEKNFWGNLIPGLSLVKVPQKGPSFTRSQSLPEMSHALSAIHQPFKRASLSFLLFIFSHPVTNVSHRDFQESRGKSLQSPLSKEGGGEF